VARRLRLADLRARQFDARARDGGQTERDLEPSRTAIVSATANGLVTAPAWRLRLALTPAEAAAAIGCSLDTFTRNVLRELRVVRRGRKTFIAVAELERWLERNAALEVELRR
jgi:hypothetical protein